MLVKQVYYRLLCNSRSNIGLFISKTSLLTWLGATVAIVGLFLLSVNETLKINIGDILVLIGAFFWAIQILVISHYSTRIDPLQLAFSQFLVCALLSLIVALFTETIIIQNIFLAYLPIFMLDYAELHYNSGRCAKLILLMRQ
jgi:drug/metabolite transporter (DMT)-like permease